MCTGRLRTAGKSVQVRSTGVSDAKCDDEIQAKTIRNYAECKHCQVCIYDTRKIHRNATRFAWRIDDRMGSFIGTRLAWTLNTV